MNVAFFGANAIYRKIRLEDSPLGSSRHQVNYRVASEDPVNGKAPDEVTVSWRDAPSNRPRARCIGGMYECNPVKADMVIGDASAWMFDGSGLKNGDKLPNAVGNEYDRVMPESPTPANIQVLAHSPVTCRDKKSFADATYYTASSGAGVFDVGTFWWIPPLKSECPNGPATSTDCKIQKVVENILRDFSLGPAGDRHPSVNNLAQFGIRPGYTAKIEPPDQDSPSASPSTTAQKSTTTTASKPSSTTGPPLDDDRTTLVVIDEPEHDRPVPVTSPLTRRSRQAEPQPRRDPDAEDGSAERRRSSSTDETRMPKRFGGATAEQQNRRNRMPKAVRRSRTQYQSGRLPVAALVVPLSL